MRPLLGDDRPCLNETSSKQQTKGPGHEGLGESSSKTTRPQSIPDNVLPRRQKVSYQRSRWRPSE
nr:hypothetical protein [uncultured bacterium]